MNTMRLMRCFLIALAACCAAATAAQSQTAAPTSGYPSKPIRLLLGVPPGGSTDIVARIIVVRLDAALGQPVIIDNRGGAGGAIASEIVAKAPPDGYTLLFAYASHTTTPFLYKNVPYDPVKSFTPITEVATQPLIITVNPSLPVKTIGELIAYAKANPGKLNIGIAGAGSGRHIASEYFKQLTGTQIVPIIYKGGGPAMIGLLSGEVQLMFASTSTAMAFIKQGKLKVIATTSMQRLPYLPDVPTFDEGGVKGLRVSPWQGLLGPAGLPRAIVDRLYTEVVKVLRMPDVRENLAATGTDPLGSTPEEFAAEIDHQLDRLGKVIRAAGMRVQ